MFVNVTNRTSSAVEDLQVDALNKQAIVNNEAHLISF